MAQGLPPGLRGWFAADEAARQQNASQLQQLQGILGIQGMLQKQQQAKAYESELGALGPNPDQGALSSLMMKYGGPQAALSHLDRAATREAANTNAAAMREQRLHELEIKGQQRADEITARAAEGRITQQQAAADRAALAQNMARLTASLRQPQQPPIIQSDSGIFERRPEGLVPLTDPTTGKPLKPKGGEKPITEFQGKNALYGSRASMADRVLTNLEEKINLPGLAVKQSLAGTPVVGGVLGVAGNSMLSANQQSVEQAQRNFVNAVLRQESGAVISDSEFENAKKQYFPQPGDSKQVIEQKRLNRKASIAGFQKIAGPAWSGVEDQLKQSEPAKSIMEQADAILRGK